MRSFMSCASLVNMREESLVTPSANTVDCTPASDVMTVTSQLLDDGIGLDTRGRKDDVDACASSRGALRVGVAEPVEDHRGARVASLCEGGHVGDEGRAGAHVHVMQHRIAQVVVNKAPVGAL